MVNKSKNNYWVLSGFFFFYFFTWSSAMSLFPIWLNQTLNLDGTKTGIIFSVNAIAALLIQPLYGIISDKIGLRKRLLWVIVALLTLVGPFFIYVYGPLLQYNIVMGAIVGGAYIGAAFFAGVGAVESYIEKIGRKYDFEYGKSRMWGSLGWASATFFAGQLFNINPNINFWIASGSGLCLIFMLLLTKVDITTEEQKKADSIKLKDVGSLLKMKELWAFMVYVLGVSCIYSVYDQQFPVYYSSLFPTQEQGNQMYGYLNSIQVFVEAGMMFAAPFIVNKIGPKKALLLAGFIMAARIIGSGIATGPIFISSMKMLHALELPIMLIAIFKYFSSNFDNRLSSTLYLVGFQFISQIGAAFLSPVAGKMYDIIGFSKSYLILGAIVLAFTLLSIFLLSNKWKRNENEVGPVSDNSDRSAIA
ncbi:MFS transporter [Priestia abyssalis]|uniref:MFS transporter n=1 Tax=Priestia abyssalis TaxID=1221450 RepID=UPI000994A7FC|nr:MFS transporter [Priestia abyssalis]